MKIDYDEVLNILGELKYNIDDGIGFINCKRDFSQHEYDVANAVIKMMYNRLEKKYGRV